MVFILKNTIIFEKWKEPLDEYERYLHFDPEMECDSHSCKIEAEENWENLTVSEKNEEALEYRATVWPNACSGLSLDDCDENSECPNGDLKFS